jgi:mannan endo-1,4-beta-mannosidase
MSLLIWWSLLLATFYTSVTALGPLHVRNNGGKKSHFVTPTSDGRLTVNGSEITLIGTTAYWLPSLNSLDDIDHTLGNISKAGFNAVRVWGFNDVDQIPENGTWFQLVQNGTTVINNGTNGLQKLDAVVNLAQKHRVYVMISLTNNWNPRPLIDNISDPLSQFRFGLRDVTNGTNNSLPRNTLSNDYGGMDLYVRQFGGPQEHDQFFTNETLISAFMNYTTQVVSRYVNSPAILSWEIANDPRCNSSVAASSGCTAQNVTRWHSRIAKHVKTIDPNHMVSSGHQGFLCLGCAKLFPRVTTPAPRPSPAAGARRRNVRARALTAEGVLLQRKEAFKKARALAKRSNSGALTGGTVIRGRWVSTPTRRQEQPGLDSSLNGAHGVDSEDILGIPEVDIGSLQLFPDQASYGVPDPNLSPFNNTVQIGLNWIRTHADIAATFAKPTIMTGFGLVTQQNAPAFVPFNTTIAPFGPDNTAPVQQPFGVTDAERDDAYVQWLQAGLNGGLQGMIQYQWSQGGLVGAPGTPVADASSVQSSPATTPGTSQTSVNVQVNGSPNDGYGINGIGFDPLVQSINSISQQFGPG